MRNGLNGLLVFVLVYGLIMSQRFAWISLCLFVCVISLIPRLMRHSSHFEYSVTVDHLHPVPLTFTLPLTSTSHHLHHLATHTHTHAHTQLTQNNLLLAACCTYALSISFISYIDLQFVSFVRCFLRFYIRGFILWLDKVDSLWKTFLYIWCTCWHTSD